MHRAAIAGGTVVETSDSPRASVITELSQKAIAAGSSRTDPVLLIGGFSKTLVGQHKALINAIAEPSAGWSKIITFGPNAREFTDRASDTGLPITSIVGRYSLRDAIVKHWNDSPSPLLAIAGSRGPNLAWAIDDALATSLSRKSANVSKRSTRVESARGQFDLVSGFGAVAVGPGDKTERVVFPSTVAGMGLLTVRQGAFKGQDLKSLMLPAPVRTIGASAFRECHSLSTLVFPSSLILIGGRSFQNATELKQVTIPDSVTTIGPRAFAGCTSMEQVILPSGTVSIAKDAFADCHPDIRFCATPGSPAEKWALKWKLPVHVQPFDDSRSPQSTYPHDTRRIKHKGIEYRVLPGGMIEAWNPGPRTKGTVSIPADVDGHPVRGIGSDFVSRNSEITRLELPPSIAWISSNAFSDDSRLNRVHLSGPLQARGEGTTTERLTRFNAGRPRDVDSVRLTLRMICHILQIDFPSSLDYLADEPMATLSASMLTSGKAGLHFSGARSLTPRTVDRLVARGVRAFVTTAPIRSGGGTPMPYVYHPDPVGAFEEICTWFAAQYDATTIAVTGSVGKTSTKEMIQRVCSTTYSTLFSAKNQNGLNQVGRYVQKLSDKIEVYVQETGAGAPRLVERGAQILHPNAFIITNIGLNHIAKYGGDQDRLLADKLSLDRYMPDDGVAFVNYDDSKLRKVELRHRIISYGVESRDTDYWAEDLVERNGQLQFSVVEAKSGSRHSVVVRSYGRHNVSNAVAAFAVGRWLRIPHEKIIAGIAGYTGEGLRQNLTEIDGRRVLVDCYNSSEVAIGTTADALQALSVDTGGRRIYVVADIDDKLGDITEEVHRRVGQELAARAGIDRFYLFGEHAAWVAEELRNRDRDVVHTVDRDELHQALQSDLVDNDVVAFKGGQQMALSITIDRLFGTAFVLSDGDVLEKRGTDFVERNATYKLIDEYGVELCKVRPEDERTQLDVSPTLQGHPVLMIGRSACARTQIEQVRIPGPVATIAQAAFFQAASLRTVELPSTLRTIGSSAFNGCSALDELVVPEGVTTIGSRAFYRCVNLKRLVLPKSLRTIEADILLHCRSVTVECPQGSFAQQFISREYPSVPIATI
ncbi:MAG: leucine-rich repeat protein [Brevibacterium sp.]